MTADRPDRAVLIGSSERIEGVDPVAVAPDLAAADALLGRAGIEHVILSDALGPAMRQALLDRWGEQGFRWHLAAPGRAPRPLAVADLVVGIDLPAPAPSPAEGRTILITGGAGSIGSALAETLVGQGARRVVLVDRNENRLRSSETASEWRGDGRLCWELADLGHRGRVAELIRRHRPQDLFHTAAYKHLALLERSPAEAVRNNVGVTRTLLSAEGFDAIERWVLVSTDKAARPTSVLGATKRLAEMLTMQTASGRAVRLPNVFGSAGSVVPLFAEQIVRGGPLTVTDPAAVREFVSPADAADALVDAGYRPASLFAVRAADRWSIGDLARRMIALAGLPQGQELPLRTIGLSAGEKVEEDPFLAPSERPVPLHAHLHRLEVEEQDAWSESDLDALLGAAEAGDDRSVRRWLVEMVPGYVG